MPSSKIYIIGTIHSNKKYKTKIEDLFKKESFDAIFVEGVKGITKLKWNYWLQEPFLLIALHILSYYEKTKGSEFLLAYKIAKKKKIPIFNIDLKLSKLIDIFHRWYNFFIFPILFYIGTLMARPFVFLLLPPLTQMFHQYTVPIIKILILIIGIIIAEILYSGYFIILITKKIRDKSFIEKTKIIMNKNQYKKVLIICGKFHRKAIKKELNAIDITKIPCC